MKYSAIDCMGKVIDFERPSDSKAIAFAKEWHLRALIKVKSFAKPVPLATLLPYKAEGY